MLGVALLHWRAHLNNPFYSIYLSSKKTSQVRKNPSGSPSSPPRDTDHYIHFAAVQTNVGREAKAPFPAPEGAGLAAKLCPPTMSLVSPGEHSLPKQTPRGQDRSCPQPASAQNPLEFLCQTHGSSELLLPIQALCLHQENVLNLSSRFAAAQRFLLSLTDDLPRVPMSEY